MKIAKESLIIAVLGTIDLITTIVFIRHHGAEEANPIFRFFWNIGLPMFILAKIMLTACPLLVLEWARKRNPRFVMFGMRSAIAGYVFMYGLGFLHLNGPGADEREVMAAAQVSYAEAANREIQDEMARKDMLRTYNQMLQNTQEKAVRRRMMKVSDGQMQVRSEY